MESATAARWRPQRVALSTSCARVNGPRVFFAESPDIWVFVGGFVIMAGLFWNLQVEASNRLRVCGSSRAG